MKLVIASSLVVVFYLGFITSFGWVIIELILSIISNKYLDYNSVWCMFLCLGLGVVAVFIARRLEQLTYHH